MRTRWQPRVTAALAALALVAVACGGSDDTSDSGTDTPSTPADDMTDATDDMTDATDDMTDDMMAMSACQVTDTGGVDDRSFNQTAYAGLERAEADLGAEISVLESQSLNDFEPNINAFLAQGCDLIVTVGFLLGDATLAAAQANPDQAFAIVDVDFFDADAGTDITLDNVKELTFKTDEAAFLAGYLAAGMTETGVLGTFGGINIPPVTIFMNGFEAGMDHYNEVKGTDVRLIGWDRAAQDGLFTGDFEDQDKGRATAESLLDEGADIILPVAGPVGLGAAAAVRDAGDASLIWVDTDGYVSASEFGDLFLTSVLKNMDLAVFEAIEAWANGTFAGGLYVGTLENGGVGLADFHDFDSEVSQELKDEIDALRAGIIAGDVDIS